MIVIFSLFVIAVKHCVEDKSASPKTPKIQTQLSHNPGNIRQTTANMQEKLIQ